MKIRTKLLVLLLVLAWVPLLVGAWLQRNAMRRLGNTLADNTRQQMETNARQDLHQRVVHYTHAIDLSRVQVELACHQQAARAEALLALRPPQATPIMYTAFGSVDPPEGTIASSRHFIVRGGRGEPMQVSYQHTSFYLAPAVNKADVLDDMRRLTGMLATYRTIHATKQEHVFWQYLALESGVHQAYPAFGGEYPAGYDPRQRKWYTTARDMDRLVWSPPAVDATTGQTVLTASVPVKSPEGKFLGVTAIDVPVATLFADLRLPERWSSGAMTFLVTDILAKDIRTPELYPTMVPELADRDQHVLLVLASNEPQTARTAWEAPAQIRLLEMDDMDTLWDMARRARQGNEVVMEEMPYDGKPCYWAMGALPGKDMLAIAIVPTDSVQAGARQGEALVRDRTAAVLQITGVLLLGVAAVVLVAALLASRNVTRPVAELAHAAQRLAGGDFDARVHCSGSDEIGALAASFNQMGPKLLERDRMKRSLALAMEIQQHLLPQGPPTLDGFDVAGQSLYCDETGGDYYDFIDLVELGPGRLGIAVGDVTGHGIGAALLMASARAVLRTHASMHGEDLPALFDALNRHLVRDTGDARFMTLFYGILHGPDRQLLWASAGHDPAIWVREGGATIEELGNQGLPLGIIDEATYGVGGPVTLATGDILMVGTDGIWEAARPDGECFGKQRLKDILAENASRSAAEIHQAVVDGVQAFLDSTRTADDLTLVVIKAR